MGLSTSEKTMSFDSDFLDRVDKAIFICIDEIVGHETNITQEIIDETENAICAVLKKHDIEPE